ncbi:MAG: heavy-metal-associated domain-containing protein [Flavobacteriales bacterium]|nr:heavy-metal-associated domain-containing protein [Flavobacteriales bacterium]
MKNTIILLCIAVFGLTAQQTQAQEAKKTAEIVVQTSAQCDMCKERLEKAMAYEKGVVSSKLDVESAKFTIVYKVDKTTPEKIRQAISKTGYDADDIQADKKAHDNLPHCCQKGGHK